MLVNIHLRKYHIWNVKEGQRTNQIEKTQHYKRLMNPGKNEQTRKSGKSAKG